MTHEGTEDRSRAAPAKRTPGRYIVYGMVAFWVLVFGFSLVLALRLEPAADRFHNPPAATHKK